MTPTQATTTTMTTTTMTTTTDALRATVALSLRVLAKMGELVAYHRVSSTRSFCDMEPAVARMVGRAASAAWESIERLALSGERGYARDLAAELGAIPEIGVVSSAALSTARESALAAIDMA